MSHQHRGEYQTHTSHLVPSMGPIVSIVASHGRCLNCGFTGPHMFNDIVANVNYRFR